MVPNHTYCKLAPILGFCRDSLAGRSCRVVVNALELNIERQNREVSASTYASFDLWAALPTFIGFDKSI